MISLVTFVVLILLTLAFVFSPVFARRSRERVRVEQERDRLRKEKAQQLALIRDIEFDWKTGKVADADYQSTREEAEGRAITILRRLDELGRIEDLEGKRGLSETEIEAEIARMRAKLKREAVELGA